MTTYVINTTNFSASVKIQRPPKQDFEFIFVQEKSKAKLPAGAVVDEGFLMQNPGIKARRLDAVGEPLALNATPSE
jgi:hypothetical protein